MLIQFFLLSCGFISILFSLFFQRGNRERETVIFLLMGAMCLRFAVALDPYLHEWDERFHALVAKHLMTHPLVPTLYDRPLLSFDYKGWGANNVWLHKPPLTFWMMALSMKTFGVNEISIRIPSLILSTIAVLLTYLIAKKLFNQKIGWMAAFFQCINGFVIEVSGGRIATDHVDVCFFFFVELAIVFAILQREKGKKVFLILFSIALASAIYCKWLPALIVVPIWWLLNFQRGKLVSMLAQLIIIFVIAITLVLPWQLYTFHSFPTEAAWENHYNFMHLFSALEEHSEPWYFYLQHATINWNELIWVAFIWFCVVAVRNKFPREFLTIICWVVIPYTFFSIAQTRMEGYVLISAPAMFIILAYCWIDWKEKMQSYKKMKIPIMILLSAVLVLAVRYSLERIKPFRFDEERIKATRAIKMLPSKIPNPNTVFFNTGYYIDLMFFTDFVAYQQVPSSDEIKKVEEQGFDIVIIDDGKIPTSFLTDSKIKIMKL